GLDRRVQHHRGSRRIGRRTAPRRLDVLGRATAMSEQSPLDRATEFLSDAESDETTSTDLDALGDQVSEVLRTVYDPEIPVNIFELGLVYKIDVDDAHVVHIDMTLTSPMCPVAESLPEEVKSK